jgi:hypothetical protein
MTKKRNVFIAKTEYHLLLSASIILKHFSNPEEHDNRIYYTYLEKRFVEVLNYESIPAEIIKIRLDNNPELKKELTAIIDFKPGQFFFFQEHSPFNIYLVLKLHNKGANICLVQDGLKPYGIVKKRFELISILRETYPSYQILRRNNLKINKLHLFRNYQYGITKEIDELWLSHPLKFINKFNKKLVELPKITDRESIEAISQFFMFREKVSPLKYKEKVIFYVNTPLYNPNHVTAEIDFLESLMHLLPESNGLLIKLHPLMESLYAERYQKIPNASVFKSSVPAELFIMNLTNSIILSGWSTALLMNNPSCNLYYNFPVYEKDKLLSQFQPSNPTDHIKIVTNPADIFFPNTNLL